MSPSPRPVPERYVFRLSQWLEEDQLEDWYAWLKARTVPCAMVENLEASNSKSCSIWRAGLESSTGKQCHEPWRDDTFDILDEANSFSKHLRPRTTSKPKLRRTT